MKYWMLLWPHANARYQSEATKLAQAELRLMLDVFAPNAVISRADTGNMPALELDMPDKIEPDLLHAISTHSLLYALFERRDDGALLPVISRAEARVGADLPGVLKYKGKTNELFLQLMLNVALYSGGFARRGAEALELLDPMCGRATALFVGANLGWNVSGMDVDRNDLLEAEKYLKRYLEYHRMKHAFARESRTVQGSKPVSVANFSFSPSAELYRQGQGGSLRLAHADAALSRAVFGKEKFHLIICDLPYGIQHASVGGNLEALLSRALPQWYAALKKGGCIALSYNTLTLKPRRLRELMKDVGLDVRSGEPYDRFEHWVEQAVTRDIAVGRKLN